MHQKQRQAIEEALSLAIDEGLLDPEKVRSWTEAEKLAWFERVTTAGLYGKEKPL